jgi:hypothetical protein
VGIGAAPFRELAELGARIALPGASVMLGRQRCRLKHPHRKHYRQALDANGHKGVELKSLFDKSGYAEVPLQKLGFGTVETMDFSDYEGAQHLADLSKPLDPRSFTTGSISCWTAARWNMSSTFRRRFATCSPC